MNSFATPNPAKLGSKVASASAGPASTARSRIGRSWMDHSGLGRSWMTHSRPLPRPPSPWPAPGAARLG